MPTVDLTLTERNPNRLSVTRKRGVCLQYSIYRYGSILDLFADSSELSLEFILQSNECPPAQGDRTPSVSGAPLAGSTPFQFSLGCFFLFHKIIRLSGDVYRCVKIKYAIVLAHDGRDCGPWDGVRRWRMLDGQSCGLPCHSICRCRPSSLSPRRACVFLGRGRRDGAHTALHASTH